MNELYTHFTMLLSKENYEKAKKEYEDMYLILAEKPCNYSQEDYFIIDVQPLDEDPEFYEFENVLNDFGALIVHESMTHGFCIIEEDIDELESIFSWDGALSFVIGEMLTPEEKKTLLKKWAKKENKSDNIYLKLNKDTWSKIDELCTDLFLDESDKYRFGTEEISIWWSDVLNTIGGYEIYIRKTPDEKDEKDYNETKHYPSPWNRDDDYYYGYYDDYDDIPAWYRERDY